LHGRRPVCRDPVLRRCRGPPRRPAARAGARGAALFLDRGQNPRGLSGAPLAHRRAATEQGGELMPTIEAARLSAMARRVFAAAGSVEAEANIVADHLVEANLKGHDSHGVGMIPSYLRNLGAGKA